MWNDAYFTIVDDYLKRYNALTVRKNNLESEMAEIEEVLNQLPVAKTTKYGWSGGRDGTWEKPSPQEAYCDKKEREEKQNTRNGKKIPKISESNKNSGND